jgi:hypothetical protein
MRNLLAIACLLLVFLQISTAQIGFVGNMFPAPGSTTMATYDPANPNAVTIYIQVYKAGVTEPAGQGGGITCEVYYGDVVSFGDPWMSVNTTTMTYNTDIGNNDEYQGDIIVSANTNYEFTCRCTDDGGATYVFADLAGGGNGRIEVEAVLPVELISFEGELLNNNEARLSWTSTNEINFSHYELEYNTKSADEIDWLMMKSLQSIEGNSTKVYQANALLSKEKEHYFRLKIIDQDGNFKYSKVISLNSKNRDLPVINSIIHNDLMIKNLKGKYWNMYIHALSGQVVLSQELEGLETFYLNVDHLESGSYFVTIRNNLQNEHVSQLIIKP